MGLIEIMIGVLADDDGFYRWQGCMTGPMSRCKQACASNQIEKRHRCEDIVVLP